MKISTISLVDRKEIIKLWGRGYSTAYLSRKYKLATSTIVYVTKGVKKGELSTKDYKIVNNEKIILLTRRKKARTIEKEKKWVKPLFKSYKDYIKEDKLREEAKNKLDEVVKVKVRKKNKNIEKTVSVWTRQKKEKE